MNLNLIYKGGITRYWWMPMLTGLLSIAIGIWCLCSPEESLNILATVFAAILASAGFFNLIFATANAARYPSWGWSLAMGILELVGGIWMLCLPEGALIATFVYIIGFFLIFAVINAICDACTFYGYASDWFGWIMAILLLTLFFAILFLAGPIGGGIAVWLYIGLSFISFGLYRIIIAAKIRRINKRLTK